MEVLESPSHYVLPEVLIYRFWGHMNVCLTATKVVLKPPITGMSQQISIWLASQESQVDSKNRAKRST